MDDTSNSPIDILNLPKANSESGIRPSVVTAGTSAAMPWASPSEGSPYGYDTNYTWLRGKLEYSQAEQQWKLRYIPVETDNDGFGGSVVLSNSGSLSGYGQGDFVEVRGRVQSQQPKKGYSPVYQVADIKSLRNATR